MSACVLSFTLDTSPCMLLTSCSTRDHFWLSQLVFVTGGGELSLTSSADSLTFSKIRFEILGHTKLVLDLPPTMVTGFQRSVSTNAGKRLLLKCACHHPSLLHGAPAFRRKKIAPTLPCIRVPQVHQHHVDRIAEERLVWCCCNRIVSTWRNDSSDRLIETIKDGYYLVLSSRARAPRRSKSWHDSRRRAHSYAFRLSIDMAPCLVLEGA